MFDSVPGPDMLTIAPPAEGIPHPTDVERYAAILQRRATPYFVGDDRRALQSSYPGAAATLTPAAGLVTTVRDLAKFDLALKQGLLLETGTLDAAWSPPNANGAALPHGMGWFVQYYNGEKVVWQFGMAEGASSSLMIMLPARGLTRHPDGEQRWPRQPVLAGERRCHVVAVCAVVLEAVRPVMRSSCLVLAVWLLAPAPVAAEWQVRPFIGFTFGGATTFVDPEKAIETNNAVIGASGGWLGEIFGLDVDFGRAPGFFQTGETEASDPDLLSSAVTTLTGNVVVALPARMAGYGLRPYFSGGAGLMHIDTVGQLQILEVHRTLPTLSLGGGVTGFLNSRVGLNWDIRRLSTLRREGETMGNSLGREQLSFWRATMAVALRY